MRSPCSKIDRVCIHIIVWKNTLGVGKSGQARGHGTNQWFMNTVLLSQIAEALHCFLLDIAKLVFVFAYDSTTNTGVLLFASSLYIWMQVQLLPYFSNYDGSAQTPLLLRLLAVLPNENAKKSRVSCTPASKA